MFIAVGYGLEGSLPDVTVNRIVDFEMIPEFKVGGPDAYARGVRNALAVLAPLASGEVQGYEPMPFSLRWPRVECAQNNSLVAFTSPKRSRGSFKNFSSGSGGFSAASGWSWHFSF